MHPDPAIDNPDHTAAVPPEPALSITSSSALVGVAVPEDRGVTVLVPELVLVPTPIPVSKGLLPAAPLHPNTSKLVSPQPGVGPQVKVMELETVGEDV